MPIFSGRQRQAKSRFALLVTLGFLVASGPPIPAQTTGGAPVSFGADVKVSGAVSDSPGTIHFETSIAANPLDARNLVAGYMEFPITGDTRPCSFSVTSDGGLSWTVAGD